MSDSSKHPGCVVYTAQPLNAAPSPELLGQTFITPTPLFFARNHAPIPTLPPEHYQLRVAGLVQQPLTLSLAELRARFPRQRVTATLMCAGNRRQELLAHAPVPDEIIWNEGALGNAEWGGYALRDVLLAAGVAAGAGHVAFEGLDQVAEAGEPFGFGGSIPLAKALSAEVLLADEMNGAPLPPLHGGPLRVVVPGYIGARSVKWVATLTVQTTPSTNYFQAQAYKLFPAHTDPETVDWATGLMLGEMPVNAVICEPLAGARLPAGRTRVRGYALTSGTRSIERVEVSADGGQTWRVAQLTSQPETWAWQLWEIALDLPPGAAQLVVRAWDSAANTQPAAVSQVWNFKGYLNNAWHRVNVTLLK